MEPVSAPPQLGCVGVPDTVSCVSEALIVMASLVAGQSVDPPEIVMVYEPAARPLHTPVVNVGVTTTPVSYTHLRAHETPEHLVCRLLLEKKKYTVFCLKKI